MGGPGSGPRKRGLGTGGDRNKGLRVSLGAKVNYSSPKFLAAQRRQKRAGVISGKSFGKK